MTVFILHSAPDLAALGGLARAVERRGHFVELETGERVGRGLQAQDALILFWSRAMAQDQNRLAGERRALDAWADGRLVIVAADDAALPVGLRDLPAVRAPAGDAAPAWDKVHQAVAASLAAKPAPAGAETPPPAIAPPPGEPPVKETPAHRRGLRGLFILIGLLAAIALAAFVFRRLQYRSFDDPLFDAVFLWSALGAAAIVAVFSFLGRSRRSGKGRNRRRARKREKAGGPAGEALYVAYAHDDAVAVGAVVAAVERAGRPVRVGASGEGGIAAAIRAAPGVLVMCSPRAFQSDSVKREVHLADRLRKPLLPVFIEEAATPDDFSFFFAGAPPLALHRMPEAQRPAAIKEALAAV